MFRAATFFVIVCAACSGVVTDDDSLVSGGANGGDTANEAPGGTGGSPSAGTGGTPNVPPTGSPRGGTGGQARGGAGGQAQGGAGSSGGTGGTPTAGGGAGGSLVGGMRGGGGQAGSPPKPAGAYECTIVMGHDQGKWIESAPFSNLLDDAGWQHTMNGGVNHYRASDRRGWQSMPSSRCTRAWDKPDRLILIVWGHSDFDAASEWRDVLAEVVATARKEYPSLRRINLQPVAAKPGCSGYGSADLQTILDAGALLRSDIVEPGIRIEVSDCKDIDGLDRFTSDAAAAAFATKFAQHYGTSN